MGVLLAGCGASSAPRPTRVTPADLGRAGDFWRDLTPDLKDDLIDAAKDRFASSHPDGATQIQAADGTALVAEIDKQYTNEANRPLAIYTIYQRANGKLAYAAFRRTMGQLDLQGQR
jgi:hypothetical protein